jgi:ATP-dependent DNA helicase RecG
MIPMAVRKLVRRTIMDKRGDGVRVILAESERLSGRRPTYELIADLEVKLTLDAAAPPESGQGA